MNYVQQAIREAVEKGGLDVELPSFIFDDTAIGRATLCRIFLDPAFWLAIGKARNWNGRVERTYNCDHPNESSYSVMNYACFQWHCFLDYLAEGKTAESFFKELLT